jgi:hypothetical protein
VFVRGEAEVTRSECDRISARVEELRVQIRVLVNTKGRTPEQEAKLARLREEICAEVDKLPWSLPGED